LPLQFKLVQLKMLQWHCLWQVKQP